MRRFIAPDGKLFFSNGVNVVSEGQTRQNYNPKKPAYAAFRFYPTTEAWIDETIERLKTWNLRANKHKGCERFRFNNHITSIVAEPQPDNPKMMKVRVESNGEFKLKIGGKTVQIKKDIQNFNVKIQTL